MQDLNELFAEGVEYTIEQKWVRPEELENPHARSEYQTLVSFYEVFQELVARFSDKYL